MVLSCFTSRLQHTASVSVQKSSIQIFIILCSILGAMINIMIRKFSFKVIAVTQTIRTDSLGAGRWYGVGYRDALFSFCKGYEFSQPLGWS